MSYILLRKVHLAAFLLILFAGTSGAQVLSTAGSSAPSISYQAQITGRDGKPISGEHTVTITLYTDAGGAQSIWTSTRKTTVTDGGILNASLGNADNPLPSPSAMDRPLWVGVSVDGTPELRPLATFSAAPVALNVADNAITTNKLAPNAVTADKIGTDYVGSISVNGERVTTKGSELNIVTGGGVRSTYVASSKTLILNGGGSGVQGDVMALPSFDGITSGINSVATMTVGSGASIVAGGGDIEATKFIGAGSSSDAVDLATAEVNGTLAVSNGGTGATSLTGIVHGNGSSAMTASNVDLSTEVSGVLAVANGGTGSATKSWWSTSGDVASSADFLGTTNAQDLILKAGGEQGLKLQFTGSFWPPNVIGGNSNTALSTIHGAFIGNGAVNRVSGGYGVIGGGTDNSIESPINLSVIGGGEWNTISNNVPSNPTGEYNSHHFLGGGYQNSIYTEVNSNSENGMLGCGTITGGEGNTLCGPAWGFIGGGKTNIISNEVPVTDDDGGDLVQHDVITGGLGNSIDSASSESFIGGGESNHIAGSGTRSPTPPRTFTVQKTANHSYIGGGQNNTISSANFGAISGGASNFVSTEYSSIGAGLGNKVLASGGTSNGGSAFIGGGWNNKTYYRFSSIPAGISLTTSAEAQTVLGAGNLDAGHGHLIYWAGYPPNDDRVFEIGSPIWGGTDWLTNNAFEVSYNGHSIVYHTNGSSIPSSKPVYQGATYVESPVYAWGEFDAAGGEIASFGISQVISLVPYGAPAGTYLVTLSPADPHGGPTPDIKQASVTVTIVNDKIDDIRTLPPPPPEMAGPQYIDSAKPIPAEQILAAGGTLRNPDPAQELASAATAPLAATTSCGYATASSIGALGVAYPRSFIVRTYQAGIPGDCTQVPLSFYLKVCHR